MNDKTWQTRGGVLYGESGWITTHHPRRCALYRVLTLLVCLLLLPAKTAHAGSSEVREVPSAARGYTAEYLPDATSVVRRFTLFHPRLGRVKISLFAEIASEGVATHATNHRAFIIAPRLNRGRTPLPASASVFTPNPMVPQVGTQQGAAEDIWMHFTGVRLSGAPWLYALRITYAHRSGKFTLRAYRAPPPLSSSVMCPTGDAHEINTDISLRALRAARDSRQCRSISLALSADSATFSKLGGQTEKLIAQFINEVNRYFEPHIGLSVRLVRQVVQSDRDPYQSADAFGLLQEFRGEVARGIVLGEADLYQLLTGRDLTGATVGLAILDGACGQTSNRVSLTQYINPAIQPILMAHEIGHNLGARHDPTNTGIMAARASDALTSFSATSRDEIATFLDERGTCVPTARCGASATPKPPPRVTLPLTLRTTSRIIRGVVRDIPMSGCSGIFTVGRSQASTSGATQQSFVGISNGSELSVTLSLPLRHMQGRGRGQRLWMRSQITCPGATVVVSPRSFIVSTSRDGIALEQWLRLLRNTG